jgi:hypothetical protein
MEIVPEGMSFIAYQPASSRFKLTSKPKGEVPYRTHLAQMPRIAFESRIYVADAIGADEYLG